MNVRAAAIAAVGSLLFSAAPSFAQRAAASTRTQTPSRVEFRPFAIITGERFTASTTFDANLGSALQPLWGGGVDVTMRNNLFVDVAVSRMSKSGQRAFVNEGRVFRTAIALHTTVTPVELTAGYRFHPKPRRLIHRHRVALIPYVGIGVGVYRFEETSDFSNPGEDVSESHLGFAALGGAEFRVSKWVGITADAQYTHVPGILGRGGISKDSSERDLGGIAGRVRVILGR